MKLIRLSLLIFSFLSTFTFSQKYTVLESNEDFIKIEVDFQNVYSFRDTVVNGIEFSSIRWDGYSFRNHGEPNLPLFYVTLGIPFGSLPQASIISVNSTKKNIKQLIPFQQTIDGEVHGDLEFDKNIYGKNAFFPMDIAKIEKPYTMRFARLASVTFSPFQYNPVTRELNTISKIVVQIKYNSPSKTVALSKVNDKMTDEFLSTSVVNYSIAQNWAGKAAAEQTNSGDEPYWYSHSKEYYKIYLNKKGVYRVTYEDLYQAGFNLPVIPVNNLELFCNGKKIPIDVTSKAAKIFGPGDYFQFVGYTVEPTPYAKTNIYNTANVYWLSYQGESGGEFYVNKNGSPDGGYNNFFKVSPVTLHYEEDKLYEPLGYAPDDKRDFWYWQKVTGSNSIPDSVFINGFDYPRLHFPDSTKMTLRVNMHGMTSNGMVSPDHNAKVYISTYTSSTDSKTKLLGNAIWDDQNEFTFEKPFYVTPDSVKLTSYNEVKVTVDGNIAGYTNLSDEIRMNWYEIDYWKQNIADTNRYYFKNPTQAVGRSLFFVWEWKRDNMKIYIPEKNQVISNPQVVNDIYATVLFVDSCYGQTEYFCVSNDYYLRPDSIRRNVASDIRNIQNGADVIVITHPKFMAAAERYANFRGANYPDKTVKNPRIKIVDVFKIYDEFSYGLLDPNALQQFVKYAFEKWSGNPPQYVVLLGDMSWDYRRILPDSRPNFVPSMPYQAYKYGRAASDNMIVCVAGDDIVPDLAVGRLSCETISEADILIDKIVNYPADKGKNWKQNILLVASGKDQNDEVSFKFNTKANVLENNFLTPNGFKASKVYRFPNEPVDVPFEGGGPEIRAGIDKGASLVNFYGHGGGYQWDFVFLNDDIPLLQNGGKLPFVASVTCYTAHFDNQDIFGEQFCKIPGKGCIGFWGSSGLTFWEPGWIINELLYDQIFNKRNYIIGNAIMKAKGSVDALGQTAFTLALLTYLGDPVLPLALPDKPDFEVKSSDISILPENPIVGDTVKVKINYRNIGTTFGSDSVTVQLFANGTDSLSQIGSIKRSSFTLNDSLTFLWTPKEGKLYNLFVKINNINVIPEIDLTDNTAQASFAVYSIADPNFISPVNGITSSKNQIDFIISDGGYYVNKNLTYFIEIDTSMEFNSLVQASSPIVPSDGFARWKSNPLANGIYFWHARINDGTSYGRWSPVRTFTITNQPKDGFYLANKQLKMFNTFNVDYAETGGNLVLNTLLKPPYPNEEKYIDNMNLDIYPSDSTSLTTLASDGTYLYFATYAYYNAKGKSRIYKIGTGYNGTVKGRSYGTVPNFARVITNSIFYHKDGFLYAVVDNNYHSLLKINPTTGDTATVYIPEGLINKDRAAAENGAFYLTSDGTYVYNLAVYDKDQNKVYTVRTFDPAKNWARTGNDMVLNGLSYGGDFTGFFVCDGYLYTSEYMMGGHLKRFRLKDGIFEEEWFLFASSNKFLFSWWYDWTNNFVYGGIKKYSGDNYLQIYKFVGKYVEARGNITSQDIGPGSKWTTLSYDIDTVGSLGKFTASVEGFNKTTNKWDTVAVKIPKSYSLQSINPSKYNYLRFNLQMVDSSKNLSVPMKFKNLNVNYTPPAEVVLRKNNFSFSPDTLLQGLQTMFTIKTENAGYTDIDSVKLDCYLNGADTAFYSPVVSIKKDSSATVSNIINTTTLLPSTTHTIKVIAKTGSEEFFSNNNITSKTFFVARDSINPRFSITYDGKEILDNDVISSRPKIIVSLTDEGPLPLRKSAISIVHSSDVDKPTLLDTLSEEMQVTANGYPNNKLEMVWTPKLKDGRHFLEIIGKDASGNLFDTVSYKKVFYVYNKSDVRNIYNFPNPFKTDTYFTFDLFGSNLPEELYIKIYTIAGRLIKTINIPQSQIQIGFNKFYWDGKDQDGDELANGLYFYKFVYKNSEILRTEIQKLAKIK